MKFEESKKLLIKDLKPVKKLLAAEIILFRILLLITPILLIHLYQSGLRPDIENIISNPFYLLSLVATTFNILIFGYLSIKESIPSKNENKLIKLIPVFSTIIMVIFFLLSHQSSNNSEFHLECAFAVVFGSIAYSIPVIIALSNITYNFTSILFAGIFSASIMIFGLQFMCANSDWHHVILSHVLPGYLIALVASLVYKLRN